jgi:aminoglycoside 3-N-acetyltransferase
MNNSTHLVPGNRVGGNYSIRRQLFFLIGVDLRRCTYIHGVEEWLDIPGRLTDDHEMLYTILPDKTEISTPQRRHYGHTSEKYDRVEEIFWKIT